MCWLGSGLVESNCRNYPQLDHLLGQIVEVPVCSGQRHRKTSLRKDLEGQVEHCSTLAVTFRERSRREESIFESLKENEGRSGGRGDGKLFLLFPSLSPFYLVHPFPELFSLILSEFHMIYMDHTYPQLLPLTPSRSTPISLPTPNFLSSF